MADLSAVLRKTIDGLPKASPDLRAKVYEKARAAIERQIATASPPLSESVIEARRSSLADAIDRTEDHYLGLEASGLPAPSAPPISPAPAAPRPADEAVVPRPDRASAAPVPPPAPRPSAPPASAMPTPQ